MRTTLELDHAIIAAARSLASSRGISLGAAVSELARCGLGVAATGRGEVARMNVAYAPFEILLGDPNHVVTPDFVKAHHDGEL